VRLLEELRVRPELIGPLIEPAAIEKVKEHVADALKLGAKVLVRGKPHKLGGLFFQPTVLTEVTGRMRIASEETFGPVAPLFRFSSEEEVIAMANDTEFGLAAYFYSRDIGRIFRVAEAIEAGMVCVNSGILSNEVVPFGGVKQSGLGREAPGMGSRTTSRSNTCALPVCNQEKETRLKTLAAVLRKIGLPSPYAASQPLSIEEVELDPPGPGEVLIRVRAAGLCHSDLSAINGDRPWPMPIVVGHEAAGEVVETGAGVNDLKPGDHVVMVFRPMCGT